jgi:F-type H+-transporting ATPase subunit a
VILEAVAALLIVVIFTPLARRLASGEPARGIWDNAFESVLTFIRDDIAKPNIGEHDADKYVPFLWTLFFFVLFNNLLGMLPWMGSPTANLYVTGALALCSFVAMHGAAMVKMGVGHYFQSLWPHIDVPFPMGYVLKPMIFAIELLGTVIKSGVLAVRLFANMFAGHTVLAMILGFIVAAGNAAPLLWTGITAASVLGVFALSILELFVAFLQSYIFVFLTALFMGMALHPAH